VKYNSINHCIYVKAHEWAWSLRTSMMPIYEITKEGIVQIGYTQKRPTTYYIDDNTIAVFREYISNNGYRTFYLYPLWLVGEDGNVKEIAIEEQNDFEIPQWNYEGLREEDIKAIQDLRKKVLDFFQIQE